MGDAGSSIPPDGPTSAQPPTRPNPWAPSRQPVPAAATSVVRLRNSWPRAVERRRMREPRCRCPRRHSRAPGPDVATRPVRRGARRRDRPSGEGATMNERTSVAVAGGGPAGMVLGLLLARAGVEVTVLEKHADFLRDFRGDTVHPSTLTLLDELGLGERFAALPQRRVQQLRGVLDGGTVTIADFT